MQLPQFAAHADMEEHHWWFLARRQILQRLLHAVLPPSKNVRIMDAGCGTGGLTHFFAKEYTMVGVDPSTEAITFATRRFPHERFVLGRVPDDVCEDFGAADAVLLIEVLEHVENDVQFVHRLIECMQPGAYLMMMAPADPSLWGPHDEAFEHFRRYGSIEEFRNTWRGMPVRELVVSHVNSRLYPLVKVMRILSALRGKSWGKGGTDITIPIGPINALLRRIFAGEANRLLGVLRKTSTPYRRGVSVVALLRKK